MDELDDESKALFASGRNAMGPSSSDRARITALLSAKLGSAALLATSGVAAGTAAKVSWLAKSKAFLAAHAGKTLLATAALVGGVSFGLHSAVNDSPSEARVSTAQENNAPKDSTTNSAPPEPKPIVELPPSADDSHSESEPAETSSTRARVGRARAQTRARDVAQTNGSQNNDEAKEKSGLSSELQLIARMHAASRKGDWAEVDRAIKAHEQNFPGGALAEEREAMRTILVCRNVSAERASELSQNFAKRHPTSTYAARVKAACTTAGK